MSNWRILHFMMIPASVQTWLTTHSYGSITASYPIKGGCINNGLRLVTRSGQSFFLKTNSHCPSDMFTREAEALVALATLDGPRVPRSFLHGPDFLLLEDLRPAPPVPDYWPILGRQLAALHTPTFPQFGFAHDNYIGSSPQPNPLSDNGYDFFAQHRLIYQAELAGTRGLLSPDEIGYILNLSTRLPDLIPPQSPSIVHGDLWSGNMISDEMGQPALIDPAAHYGWGEADLAMTSLFGTPPQVFYRAYCEVRFLAPGLEARFPIYNLYHLLNHLNLFGRGYYGQVLAIIRRFR